MIDMIVFTVMLVRHRINPFNSMDHNKSKLRERLTPREKEYIAMHSADPEFWEWYLNGVD